MSNTKYNWEAYMPKIVKLYMEGLSIPKIHEAIQNESEGFTPSLAIVYSKLRSDNYPTNQAERTKFLSSCKIAAWPSELTIISHNGSKGKPAVAPLQPEFPLCHSNPQINQYSSFVKTHIGQQNLIQNGVRSTSTSWTADQPNLANGAGFSLNTENEQRQKNHLSRLPEEPMSSWLETEDTEISQGQNGLSWDVGQETLFPDLGIEYPDGIFKTPSLPTSEIHTMKPETQFGHENPLPFQGLEPGADDPPEHRNVYRSTPFANEESPHLSDTPSPCTRSIPSSKANFSRPTATSYFGGRVFPFRKPNTRNNRCPTPEKRNSTATTDSGYGSGRNSPFNLLTEGERAHPRSLGEFKGLYRVPCSRLHEPRSYNDDYMPQPTGRFRDTERCQNCQYSSIHNLSWSAKQLKLEVFMAELRLDVLYNVIDLDAAGNSALHYAAAGGASFEHFNGLIQAGVNPYQLNTNGQLFLHCLRPQLKNPGSESFDAHLITAFNLNLVNLLNHFRLTGAFRWRDNEGMTAVDALALQINDVETRRQIFGAVLNAGHPLEVSNQFKKKSRDPHKPSHQTSSPSNDIPLMFPEQDSRSKSDFEQREEKQKRAWDLLRRASSEPSYVDPETGDNALHALSRIRFPQTRSHMKILSSIRAFVSKDSVDLNLLNREQESPLTAIICHRPFQGIESDETGATMSKYLDALLWKDPLRRIANKINVNMRNRKGVTALYYAAIRGRPDSVRSLIEAGANVNARLIVDGHAISILQATLNAKAEVVHKNENPSLRTYLYDNVISYLEHENAVADPTISDERRLCPNSVRLMPL